MTPRHARRYVVEFGLAMLGYVVLLPVSIWNVQANPDSPWRFGVGLAPGLMAVACLIAMVRHLRRLDELQVRVQLEAVALAAAGTAVLTFSYGLLENAGLPRLSWIYVLPLMTILWSLGQLIAARRYR